MDTLLEISAACDTFADVVTDVILRDAEYDRATVRGVVSAEIFMCAQDMKALFAPVSEEEALAVRAAILKSLDGAA